jgi:HEAT repeat protein
LQLAADLRSGDAERIRGALLRVDAPDPLVVSLLLPLLAHDGAFPDVLRTLRRVAPQVTGQLVDALVDARQPPRVRRRIPRVLKACPTPRAVEGLLLGLGDGEFTVRRACGTALAWMHDRDGALAVPAAPVYSAVVRELTASGADPDAQLDHVFALLSAVGEREPLRVSRWALDGQDQRIRGTALEYLEHVLPDGVRQPLLLRLGATVRVKPARALDEVEEELERSSPALPRGLIGRRRR